MTVRSTGLRPGRACQGRLPGRASRPVHLNVSGTTDGQRGLPGPRASSSAGHPRSRSMRPRRDPRRAECSPGTSTLHDASYAARFPDLPVRPRPRSCCSPGSSASPAPAGSDPRPRPQGRSPPTPSEPRFVPARPARRHPRRPERRTPRRRPARHLGLRSRTRHPPARDPDARLSRPSPSITTPLSSATVRSSAYVGSRRLEIDLSKYNMI